MCMSCGCVLAGTGTPDDDHGKPGNITLAELGAAADAAGITVDKVIVNMVETDAAIDQGALDGIRKMLDEVAKAEPEQRYVLGVAYQPGRDTRIAKGVDGGRDFFTEVELEKAAFQLLQNGPTVGLYHIDGTEGRATVVESYIYRGPDWDLGDGIVVKKGWWLVGAILDEGAWKLHKEGKINGWSPQGIAKRRRRVTAPSAG